MTRPANFIDQNHPSFGTNQAWYTFAMRIKGSITKLFLVNAKNPWAVQCIERLLGDDQKVSATCECIMVFRDCSIGVRNDLVEEISLEEFISVIVDKSRFLNDGLTIEAFQRSIQQKMSVPVSVPVQRLPPPRRPHTVPIVTERKEKAPETKKNTSGPGYQKTLGILIGIGYKSAQIEPILRKMDVDFDKDDMNEIVHIALQHMAA